MKVITLALIMGLAGCGVDKVAAPIQVKGDVYCDISQKIHWSKADTPETVRQVVRENAKHDRVCGVKTS